MPLLSDHLLRCKIAALSSELLVEEDEDFPEPTDRAVVTLLFPCFNYQIAPMRLLALRDLAVAADPAKQFLLKLMNRNEWVYEVTSGGPTRPPSPSDFESHAERIAHDWESMGYRRLPNDLYFAGRWSRDVTEAGEIDFGKAHVLENLMLDDEGAWALLVSDDDYGYLVASADTTATILSAWRTSPEAELEAFREHIASTPTDITTRVLRHAERAQMSR